MAGFHLRRDGRTVRLLLDGSRGNALGDARYAAIARAAAAAGPDDILLIRAEGRHFSVGQDLEEFRRAVAADRAAAALRHGADAILAVLECRGTVVVAGQGAAVGGGALLLAAAHVAIMAEDAWLELPELRLGMPLGASVAELMLPPPLVRRMMLTSERVPAAQVSAVGGARVVPADQLGAVAEKAAVTISALRTAALATARECWMAPARSRAASGYRREVEVTFGLLSG